MVMKHRHPSAVVLEWYSLVEKDEDGYALLSSLVECLKVKCGIEGRVFFERISSKKWQESYGWHLKFHPWKPNRVKLIHDDDCNLKLKKRRTQERGSCTCTLIPSKSGKLAGRRSPRSLLRVATLDMRPTCKISGKWDRASSQWFLKRQRTVEVGTGPTQLSSSPNLSVELQRSREDD